MMAPLGTKHHDRLSGGPLCRSSSIHSDTYGDALRDVTVGLKSLGGLPIGQPAKPQEGADRIFLVSRQAGSVPGAGYFDREQRP